MIKKILKYICFIRGKILTWYWEIEIDGHFYKEYNQGYFICSLCDHSTQTLYNKNKNN